MNSEVERLALDRSGQKLIYPPAEKMGVIVVENFPALGKLAALRFLEWVQENPGGVISLPTGKTPEYFIWWVSHYMNTWDEDETRQDLQKNGIDTDKRPDMQSLHFVQIDEFYPMNPTYQNSFYYYVNRFYISGFSLDPQKALLIDCSGIGGVGALDEVWPDAQVDLSLRYRHARDDQELFQKQVLEAVDQWCHDYEKKIRSLGGIGFFLGGVGPDGHIAFNMRGADHNSTTRLAPMNYETQAAAAVDLGGIEVARRRLVITIGLSTITYNPGCTAIIIAAGEAKARVVRDAVEEEKHIRYPATVLQELPNARLYVTRGAANLLVERQYENFARVEAVPGETIEKLVFDLALKHRKRVRDLDEEDFRADRFGQVLLDKVGRDIDSITGEVDKSLLYKLEAGSNVRSGTVFLHTAPHHDDIMLGYLPYAVRHIRDASNTHTFAYMTSGFTSVTNRYALSLLEKLQYFLKGKKVFEPLLEEGYFRPNNINGRHRDIWQYLDGVAAESEIMKDEGEARRLLRNLMEIFEEENIDNLEHRIDELSNYFKTQYSGRKDLDYIQRLKGMIREWEVDCLWGYLGFDSKSVKHLRLGFYRGEIFTEEPRADRDVPPILRLLKDVNPDVITVALDPEASGPDTHYKVLQAISEALKSYEGETRSDIEVLGYRNVWYRFHPAEANIYVPVSLNMFAVLQNAFMNAFGSQKAASFPSYECDGPFSILAQQIQVQQYQMLKTCLGRQFFNEHPSPLIRATRGFVFLRRMSLQEFYSHARELREATEDRD